MRSTPTARSSTSVDLDHQDYLGDTREAIGFEKAGIFRGGRPAICADPIRRESLLHHARKIGAELVLIERDFGYVSPAEAVALLGPRAANAMGCRIPRLRGAYQFGNAAACLTALDAAARSPARERAGHTQRSLACGDSPRAFRCCRAGRRSSSTSRTIRTPHARLAAALGEMPKSGKVIAVFAMLKDKDIAGVAAAVKDRITHWLVAIRPDRAAPRQQT